MIKQLFSTTLVLIGINTFAQTAIDVADNTMKVAAGSEELMYYGFAEGDQIIFNFEEVNGKELKELEIMAMPSSSLFMDYKTKKIDNKTITIPETGVYKFRFANSNLFSGRVCKYKIQRIPASEATQKFNTVAYKRTVYDTSYTDVPERYKVSSDTITQEVMNQVAKVHSSTNANGNTTSTNFILPANTISWSYYIGVGQEGQQAYEEATQMLASNELITANPLISSNPLTALALGLAPEIAKLQAGEDIDFYIVPSEEVNLLFGGQPCHILKRGKVINDFCKMNPAKGSYSFCLSNDNVLQGVQVTLRVQAIVVNETWDTRMVRKMTIASREELYLKH